jgi:hypothetical protein
LIHKNSLNFSEARASHRSRELKRINSTGKADCA